MITKDSDYASKLNPTQAKVFLKDEWTKVKGGTLYLHEQISLFFKTNYPDEDFSLEIEKRSSIEALINSGNFASTHGAVASLEPYLPFLTTEEAEEILKGALANSQVVWIASDPDVEAFLTKMLQEHGDSLSENLRKRVEEVLGTNSDDLSLEDVAMMQKDSEEGGS